MNDTFWQALLSIVIIFLVVGSIFYYVHSKNECNNKDGVLVRSAAGFYACVDGNAVR